MVGPDDATWAALKETVRPGDIINVVVTEQAPFGVFVQLPNTTVRGVIEIISLSDERPEDVVPPPVGTSIRAVVLGVTEAERELRLSAKPSVIREHETRG